MTVTSYDWIKQLPTEVFEKDSVPLIGYPPSFPAQQLSEKLQQLFSIPNIQIEIKDLEWRETKKLLAGLGDNPVSLNFSIMPLDAPFSLYFSNHDFLYILETIFEKKSQNLPMEVKNSFIEFLALEIANLYSQIDFDKGLSLSFLKEFSLPDEILLSLDIAITFKDRVLNGRIFIPSNLQQKWKERFQKRSLNLSLSSKLDLDVHLYAGRIDLSPKEWSKVNPGDLLLLDTCSLKSTGEGKVYLTINDIPLFRGKVKNGKIKILEYSLYHEATTSMNDEQDANNNAELYNEEDQIEENKEEDLENQQEENFIEEDNFQEEKWPPLPEKPVRQSDPAAQRNPAKISQDIEKEGIEKVGEEEKPLSLQEVPLSIVVEVGRIKMSIQKLMELQPGNILDLNIHPENGVDLVVSGKRVAKGELLLIGETLGIRVLDIG